MTDIALDQAQAGRGAGDRVFRLLEALQNAAKHAGRAAHVTASLQYAQAMLTVRVRDDGHGSGPARYREGAGLGNVRDRVETVGGRHQLISGSGGGMVQTISPSWPRRQPRTDRPNYVDQQQSPPTQI